MVKYLPAITGDIGDVGLIPGSGRSSRGRNDNPFQYSCLGNLMDKGAWWATVHGFAKESRKTVNKTTPSPAVSTRLFSMSVFPFLLCK